MPQYVDGFVIPVPKKMLRAYLRMSAQAGKIWREYGALDFCECVGEDLVAPMSLSFPKGIRTKPGETVVFSYIVFRSRAARDRVNARVMKDPRTAAMCTPDTMPFDVKRMLCGGFSVAVRV
jgi:uncharacterized protein YbaA (DUF1428 family)